MSRLKNSIQKMDDLFTQGFKSLLIMYDNEVTSVDEFCKKVSQYCQQFYKDNNSLKEWISVEDRLPDGLWGTAAEPYYNKYSEQVNILSSNGAVGTAAYDREKEDWFCNDITHAIYFKNTGCKVTHWQSLPKPPKQ
jgi:hypothetical protein